MDKDKGNVEISWFLEGLSTEIIEEKEIKISKLAKN